MVDLSADWGISSTFNVEDLIKFRGSAYIPSDHFERPSVSDPKPTNSTIPNTPVLPNIPTCKNKIDCILDEQVMFTRGGSYQRYLVRWRGRPDSDATWIPRAEVQRLAPELLQEYDQAQLDVQQAVPFDEHSTESSFSHPGRIDEVISTRPQIHQQARRRSTRTRRTP